MQLTGHELTAASSAATALAIVGGYLGVRSANRNAVRIAREERLSRGESEANALMRATYARSLTALNVLAVASMEFSRPKREMHSVDAPSNELQEEYDAALAKCSAAEVSAHNVGAEIDLIAPPAICELEAEAHDKATTCENRTQDEFLLARSRLRISMRYHLQGHTIPEYDKLSELAKNELKTNASLTPGQHILGR
jgi:hypothetical protein